MHASDWNYDSAKTFNFLLSWNCEKKYAAHKKKHEFNFKLHEFIFGIARLKKSECTFFHCCFCLNTAGCTGWKHWKKSFALCRVICENPIGMCLLFGEQLIWLIILGHKKEDNFDNNSVWIVTNGAWGGKFRMIAD